MLHSIAQIIASALGGHRAGSGWMGCCPTHEDATPSLSITETEDGRLLVHCHAGCSQQDVIAALHRRGLWLTPVRNNAPIAKRVAESHSHALKRRIAHALHAWCEARLATGSLVQNYLQARGISMQPPRSIRFHPGLKHCGGDVWPAMIGLVTVGGRPVGIHRTYLTLDGRGKALVQPNKMMLGPCRGGAVRLGVESEPLMIGEGIETCLAAMQASGNTAWAALSTSGLRALELPKEIRDIIVLADGDAPGEVAAVDAALRWQSEGRRVRIARAPAGSDFNDLLLPCNGSTGEVEL